MLLPHKGSNVLTEDNFVLSISILKELLHRQSRLVIELRDKQLEARFNKSEVTLCIQVKAVLGDEF
jgi:hypothetical protein